MFHISVAGCANPDPGPGTWAALVYENEKLTHELSGQSLDTTTNEMEITAIVQALQVVQKQDPMIEICTDSTYVMNVISRLGIFLTNRVNGALWHQYEKIVDDINADITFVEVSFKEEDVFTKVRHLYSVVLKSEKE